MVIASKARYRTAGKPRSALRCSGVFAFMRITVKDNIRDVIQRLDRKQREEVPFAVAKALTDTAKALQAAMPEALDRALDQPKPYTKRGTFVSAARKRAPVATVGFKDRQARYMVWQIHGGQRKRKEFETRLRESNGKFSVPGPGARLDQYGNISRAQLLQIAKGIKGDSARAKQFFAGVPLGKSPVRPAGVYARTHGGRRIVPVLLFSRSARYRKRFNFVGLAQRVVAQQFAQHFDSALRSAIGGSIVR